MMKIIRSVLLFILINLIGITISFYANYLYGNGFMIEFGLGQAVFGLIVLWVSIFISIIMYITK